MTATDLLQSTIERLRTCRARSILEYPLGLLMIVAAIGYFVWNHPALAIIGSTAVLLVLRAGLALAA